MLKTMAAIGRLVAHMAREQAKTEQANGVIDLAPLLAEWQAGTMENPIAYAVNDVRTRAGIPYRCAQAHTHHGEPGWGPGEAPALWVAYHATDAAHALPYQAPTMAEDAYNAGEWMIWTDGRRYQCTANATVYGPDVLPGSWEVEA